jgi:GNAT superfamily N-acetyltransferase
MEIIQAEAIHSGDAAYLFDQYRQFYKQKSDLEAALKFLEERIRKGESIVFLAYLNDRPVGFMQLYPTFSSVGLQRVWVLNDLFVEEDYRSRGIASALLDTATDFGKRTNAKYLMLQTSVTNLLAQHLYESKGWIRDADLFYTFDLVDLKTLKTPKLTPSIKK